MSKIVTIPTDGMNPFVVTHNGEKYVFTPGEEVEVSDGVALEIEEYKRWRTKHHGDNEPPFGGADWSQNDPNAADYVKNRTHYEETTVVNEPLNITWDGNTEGLVKAEGAPFYKVSDAVLTNDQLKSATVVSNNGNQLVVADVWEQLVEFGLISEDISALYEAVVSVRKSGATIKGTTFPEAGIYFSSGNGMYVSSLTTTEPVEHTKTVVKKLDKKFLPDDVGGGNEITFYVTSGSNDYPYIYTDSSAEVIATRENIIDAIGTGAKIALINLADNSKCYPFIRADMEKGCIIFEFYGVNFSGIGAYRKKYTGEYNIEM